LSGDRLLPIFAHWGAWQFILALERSIDKTNWLTSA